MTMTMKPGVLFLLSSLTSGGAERHVISLLNRLDIQAFRLSLAYLKPETQLLAALQTNRLDAVVSLNVKRKLDLTAVRAIAQFIDRHEVQVVVSTNPYPALYSALAARLAAHRPRQVEVFHSTTLHSRKEKLQMALYRVVFRGLDLLVYVSRLQRDYWSARGLRARRETVIHNGIDTAYFSDHFGDIQKHSLRARFEILDSDYVVGICAALRPEKAHGDYLLAISRLRKLGLPAKGLIIGEGPERVAIERRIMQLGLAQHVSVTGFQADVRLFVASCDVMTLTSHSVETFSLAALESMSMGKPMVMTRIGGAEEQVSHGITGFLFAPKDIDALTGFLSDLALPERRSSMGTAAALSVRAQFTEERMLNSFSTELTRLADPMTG
jgi:glycosyltransferase involved in cell wall biosynthesis